MYFPPQGEKNDPGAIHSESQRVFRLNSTIIFFFYSAAHRCNEGKDFSPDFLRALYDGILECPIEWKEEHAPPILTSVSSATTNLFLCFFIVLLLFFVRSR